MAFATDPPSGHFTKRAWIRNPHAPALGQINCPCHNAPLTPYTPGPHVVCNCGRIYTWDGWIISDQPTIKE